MAEIIVVGFKGTQRASEVLDQVRGLDEDWKIELKDAVAVSRAQNGKLQVDKSVQPTEEQGAAFGAVMGGMIGALLAAPFTAGMSIPAAGAAFAVGGASLGASVGGVMGGSDAADWKREYGITDDFVKDVAGMVQPGQSAVFVLAHAYDPAEVVQQFQGYGGRILRTTLSKTAAAKLQTALRKRETVA